MTWWRCPHCKRHGEPTDARQGWHQGDRDEPSHVYDGCRVCVGDPDDDDHEADTRAERRMSEEREA